MRAILTLCLVLAACWGNAQKMQLGKVSVKELEERFHPGDTAAVGSVLYNKGRAYFKYNPKGGFFSVVHEFEIRIKIYKKEGLGLANYEIPYYVGYKNLQPETLRIEDAATYNLIDGKIRKAKVGGDGTFKEKVNENWKTTTIVFPEATVGSVLEFKYTLKSENIHVFPNFKFQRDIPVKYVEYRTEIPQNYTYKAVAKGFFPIKSEVVVKQGSQSYENQYQQTEVLTYSMFESTYTATDLPALRDEEYVDNLDNYRASIEHELEMIRFPNTPDKNLAQTWEGLAKTIYADADFGKQLEKRDFFEADLRRIITGVDSKADRTKIIFNYVKNRMNWNGKLGFFTRDGLTTAYSQNTGNAAEINLLLVSMLNHAGVECYPVLVSTIGNGVPAFPNQSAFDYVVAAAFPDGDRVLLDAANKNTAPGIVSAFALNWTGRLIKQTGESSEIDMTPPQASRQNINLLIDLADDGSIQGKARLQRTDYSALSFREKNNAMSLESYLEKLEESYNGARITNYSVENEVKYEEPLLESFDFTINEQVERLGDKMYLDPLLFLSFRKNPFTASERKLPVYFGYPEQKRWTISLRLPKGYIVESVPESVNLTTGGKAASFKLMSQKTEDKLVIVVTYETGLMLVSADSYPVLQEFYHTFTTKLNEKIVLKKV